MIGGLLAFVLILFACACNGKINNDGTVNFVLLAEEKSQKPDWWQTGSFYQIYPRSFKDTNNDGVGDLNGITENLEYLKQIGITAAWLSPIFKSPMADFGYDISDFYDIQPEYGTLADFDRLIARAKQLRIKILLDFVPNHSSDESIWFQRSANREPGWEEFYIWHPGYVDEKNASRRLPPNNWVSVFRKSAWQWNEKRKEFYFHQFAVKQPDLNYRNPKVVNEMKNVMRFWLDRGISGYRVDAVPHLFEVPAAANGRIPDEPLSGNTDDPDDWSYLIHIYTVNQPETIDMVYQWRQVLDDYKQDHGGDSRVMMTEAYTSLDILSKYFGNATHNGSHIPFNFQLLERIHNTSTANEYIDCIEDWFKFMPKGRTPNWVMGNHDQARVGSRLGTDRVDLINMLILTLPGASVTYNGEEIGMTNQWISWNDTVDPAACNSNPSIYERFSRDPERTPFQWSDERNAGFSTARKTWLPVASNYKTVNVKAERTTERSHLQIYTSLQRSRLKEALQQGDVTYKALSQQVVAILRNTSSSSYVTVINVGPFQETVNLKQLSSNIPNVLKCAIVSTTSAHEIGMLGASKVATEIFTLLLVPCSAAVSDQVQSTNLVLQPKEGLVLEPASSFEIFINFSRYQYDIVAN